MGSDGLTQSPAATRRFRPMPSDADFLAYDQALAAWQQAPEAGPPPEFPWPEVQTVAVAPAPVKAPEAALPSSASALDHAVAIAQTTAQKLKVVYKDSLKPVLDKIAVYQAWWPNQVKYGIAYALKGLSACIPAQAAATVGTWHFGAHAHTHFFTLPNPTQVPFLALGPIILNAIQNVAINGCAAAIEGSIGASPTCGGFFPLFTVKTGSSSVFIGGERAARRWDFTEPCDMFTPSPEVPNHFLAAFAYITPKLHAAYKVVTKLQESIQWPLAALKLVQDGLATTYDSQALSEEIDNAATPELKAALVYKQEMMDVALRYKYLSFVASTSSTLIKGIVALGKREFRRSFFIDALKFLKSALPFIQSMKVLTSTVFANLMSKIMRLHALISAVFVDPPVYSFLHTLALFGSQNVFIGGIWFSNDLVFGTIQSFLNKQVMGPVMQHVHHAAGKPYKLA